MALLHLGITDQNVTISFSDIIVKIRPAIMTLQDHVDYIT